MFRSRRSAGCRPFTWRPCLAFVVVLGALVTSGCSGVGLGRDVARVLSGEHLEVAGDDGWVALAQGDRLPDGAHVRNGDGPARLRLADGEAWLAPHSVARLARHQVQLVRGEVLLVAGRRLAVRWDDVEAQGAATYRLSAGVTPRVGVYDGQIRVRRPGETKSVPGLRQLSLARQRLSSPPAPLAYRADDSWDRALLAAAIAFDEEAARLARGIDREFGAEARAAAFYEDFVAVRPATVPLLAATSRWRDGERFGPPADALLTLFVASAVADALGADLADAVREVASLREAGARWGLIAVEHGIGTRDLAHAVDLAQERRLVLGGDEQEAEATAEEDAEPPADAAAAEPTAPAAPDGTAPAATDGTAPPAAGSPGTTATGTGSGGSGTDAPQTDQQQDSTTESPAPSGGGTVTQPAPAPAPTESDQTSPPSEPEPDEGEGDDTGDVTQDPDPVADTVDVIEGVIDGLVGDDSTLDDAMPGTGDLDDGLLD